MYWTPTKPKAPPGSGDSKQDKAQPPPGTWQGQEGTDRTQAAGLMQSAGRPWSSSKGTQPGLWDEF